MLDAYPTRPALRVSLITVGSIEGADDLMLTMRTDAAATLELRLTRPQAADLLDLIAAERSRVPPTDIDTIGAG